MTNHNAKVETLFYKIITNSQKNMENVEEVSVNSEEELEKLTH